MCEDGEAAAGCAVEGTGSVGALGDCGAGCDGAGMGLGDGCWAEAGAASKAAAKTGTATIPKMEQLPASFRCLMTSPADPTVPRLSQIALIAPHAAAIPENSIDRRRDCGSLARVKDLDAVTRPFAVGGALFRRRDGDPPPGAHLVDEYPDESAVPPTGADEYFAETSSKSGFIGLMRMVSVAET